MSVRDPAVKQFLDALADYLRRHPTLPQARPVDVRRYHAIGQLMARYLPRGRRQTMQDVLKGLRAHYGCTYSAPFAYALWAFGLRYRSQEVDPAVPWSTYKASLSSRPTQRTLDAGTSGRPARAKRLSG